MNNKKIMYGVGVLLAIVFCLWLFEGRRIYAKVGDFKIYKIDVEHRNKLIRLNYPQETRDLGYTQLEKSYIHYQVMRNHGYKQIEVRVKNEAERIDKETKNPEMLKKIKNEIFGGDGSSYKRAFVIPAAVDEEVYFGFYSNNQELHGKTLKIAEDFLAEIKSSSKKLKTLADEKKYAYSILSVHPLKGLQPVNLQTLKPIENKKNYHTTNAHESDYWIKTVLKDLKEGDSIAQPLSMGEQWFVGKILKKNPSSKKGVSEYMVELIAIPKTSYSELLEEEKKRIAIRKGCFLF